MDLEIRDGKVVWLKGDGSVSKNPVNPLRVVKFCGFTEPYGTGIGVCKSMVVLMGDPLRDEIILVEAHGHSWGGTFLLSKATDECVRIRRVEIEDVKELVSLRGVKSVEEMVERKRRAKRDAVNIEALAKQKGLMVWEARYFDGYWCPDHGEFSDFPEGWDLLPKGDAALTRRVRRGPHWVLMRKKADYSVEVGTFAPAGTIQEAFLELGGEEGASRRLKSKISGRKKREKWITEQLEAAIYRNFPKIPRRAVSEILKKARRPGAVGTVQWVYFPTPQSIESMDRAAFLAVRAHARHRYTRYERLIIDTDPWETDLDDIRRYAREEVADEIYKVLQSWTEGPGEHGESSGE